MVGIDYTSEAVKRQIEDGYLDLTTSQIKAFDDYFKQYASNFSNGSISVKNGAEFAVADLANIHIPVSISMYLTPVSMTKFSPDSVRNLPVSNYALKVYQSTYDVTAPPNPGEYAVLDYAYVDLATNITYTNQSLRGSHTYLCFLNSEGVWASTSHYITKDYFYFKKGNYLSINNRQDRYSKGELSASNVMGLGDETRLLLSDSYILSSIIPTVIDNAISIPTTSVPVKTAVKDVTTTFPLDWTDDTVISVPVPNVDTVVQDLTDAKSIPIAIAIPDEIVQDVPNLLMPSGITQKFPFCLPFDFVNGLKLFVAPAVPPKISQYVGTTFMGREFGGTLTIDFAPFSVVAKLSRILSTIGFIWLLAFSTKKLMGGGQ